MEIESTKDAFFDSERERTAVGGEKCPGCGDNLEFDPETGLAERNTHLSLFQLQRRGSFRQAGNCPYLPFLRFAFGRRTGGDRYTPSERASSLQNR